MLNFFCRSTPPAGISKEPTRRRLASVALAALLASALAATALAAGLRTDAAPPRRQAAIPVLVETFDATPVDLRVGPHHFRIPRHYFRHPPNRSGVDDGFALRVLLPGMEPITEANRHVFRLPFSTDEGRRTAWVVYTHRADLPQDSARWRLANQAEGKVASLDDFPSASEATHGLRALIAPPKEEPWMSRGLDLYWGSLPGDGRFVGMRCDGAPEKEPGTCALLVDWGGRPLTVDFERRERSRWREIAAASLALVDRLAAGGEERAGPVGR